MRAIVEAISVSVEVTHPAIISRIMRAYRPQMSEQALYEIARGVWVIGPRRAGAKYALAVYGGIVREVFEIAAWHPAGATEYQTRPADHV